MSSLVFEMRAEKIENLPKINQFTFTRGDSNDAFVRHKKSAWTAKYDIANITVNKVHEMKRRVARKPRGLIDLNGALM